jgi:2-polyprenyl-3-methyl-5-hydroxy-6-metoxy-1,4-benzoquinol methylase
MDPFITNSSIWSKIYESGRSNLSFPNENLVRLCNYLFQNENIQGKKLLDFGFGSGNNLKFFHDIGFNVYGFEVNQAAKTY